MRKFIEKNITLTLLILGALYLFILLFVEISNYNKYNGIIDEKNEREKVLFRQDSIINQHIINNK